jgi:hypothetical protein
LCRSVFWPYCLTFIPGELHWSKKLVRRKTKQQDISNTIIDPQTTLYAFWSVLVCRVISCPSFGVFKDPRQDRNNSTRSFALLFFSPRFIEQKKLRKFIKQTGEAANFHVVQKCFRMKARWNQATPDSVIRMLLIFNDIQKCYGALFERKWCILKKHG